MLFLLFDIHLHILVNIYLLCILASDQFDTTDAKSNFAMLTNFVIFTFLRKDELNAGVRNPKCGVYKHMGVYGCVTDAYGCIPSTTY